MTALLVSGEFGRGPEALEQTSGAWTGHVLANGRESEQFVT
ncbi:MAG: hypothetical protein ACT443_07830 [Gemmatimonadota bacterium]